MFRLCLCLRARSRSIQDSLHAHSSIPTFKSFSALSRQLILKCARSFKSWFADSSLSRLAVAVSSCLSLAE